MNELEPIVIRGRLAIRPQTNIVRVPVKFARRGQVTGQVILSEDVSGDGENSIPDLYDEDGEDWPDMDEL